MIRTREIDYPPFGRCLEMENGAVRLLATLDLGPRIISFGTPGGKNVFAELPDSKAGEAPAGTFDIFGDKGVWHIYGGHRLWSSPEAMPRSYFPDNSAVSYKVEGNVLTLSGDAQEWIGLCPSITITMDEKEPKVTVLHTLKNTGAWPITFAPWALSVMAPGGTLYLPQNTTDKGLLHNRVFSLWPYSDATDERFTLGKSTITLRQLKTADTNFKIGIACERSCGAYLNDGTLFAKRYTHEDGATYPDGGVSLEAFTCADMLEFETLAPCREVAPGAEATHTETWYIHENVAFPETEEEIETLLATYCK